MSSTPISKPRDLVIDLAATELTPFEQQMLSHPAVRGVIFFTRNFKNKSQLTDLIDSVRECSAVDIEISVDQEGGRVQRLRDGFSELPALRTYGEQWQTEPAAARQAAFEHGQIVGQECAEIGFDLVYAPVLDLDWGLSEVIGDRAFHADPQVVGVLGTQMMAGLHAGGVSAVAKHFPGHGGVVADSHHEHAIDQRSLVELAADMAPYRALIEAGLEGVMMAHVSYPEIDADEAGYSAFWIEQLRTLGFNGVIHSDDLSMAGASAVGDLYQRVVRARQAGCERLLVCNRSVQELSDLLDQL